MSCTRSGKVFLCSHRQVFSSTNVHVAVRLEHLPFGALLQGIDSQCIKYCEEESGYVLDPRLRLGLKQRAMATEMLEMGWLFTTVVRYNQSVDGEADMGSLPLTLLRCHCLPRQPIETEVQGLLITCEFRAVMEIC